MQSYLHIKKQTDSSGLNFECALFGVLQNYVSLKNRSVTVVAS